MYRYFLINHVVYNIFLLHVCYIIGLFCMDKISVQSTLSVHTIIFNQPTTNPASLRCTLSYHNVHCYLALDIFLSEPLIFCIFTSRWGCTLHVIWNSTCVKHANNRALLAQTILIEAALAIPGAIMKLMMRKDFCACLNRECFPFNSKNGALG